jgi:hypothetical protein
MTVGFTAQLVSAKERKCELHHSTHSPRPHVLHWHHIHPLGEGGPDVKENKRTACPTGHYNVHDLLDEMLKANTTALSYLVLQYYTKDERAWAVEGFTKIMEWRTAHPDWKSRLADLSGE